MKTTNRILILSITFGFAGWVLTTVIDYLFFFSGSFWDLLIFNIPPEEYLIRIVIVALFIFFGVIMIQFIAPLEKSILKSKIRQKDFNNLVNLSQDIIVGLDREGIVNLINDRGCKIIGLERDEIIGKNWFENFIPSRIKFEMQKGFERMMIGENIKKIYEESSIKIGDGSEKVINWNDSIRTDLNGIITGTLSSGIDVTSEKNIELEKNKLTGMMEEQANLLEIILLAAPDLIFLWNADAKFTYVNFQAAQCFGLDRLELVGKHWHELNQPEEVMKILDAKRQLTMVSGESLTDEIVFNTLAGPREYEYILTPIKNSQGLIDNVVFSARDITDRKTHEIELIEANKKAKESDRLKTEFLSQMSHEIRTPLHTILSYISLLKDEISEGRTDYIEHGFSSIDIGSKRLVRTIEMILNMSQIQTGTYTPDFRKFDLPKDILETIVNEASHSIQKKDLEIVFEINSDDAVLRLDRYTATQIFRNLLDNAVKYTLKGTITVRVYKNESGKICVNIEDTGIGISKKYVNKLFQPFSQEETGFSRKYEGNGLGLALSKKYCELNNAEIEIESEKGKGTIVSVKF